MNLDLYCSKQKFNKERTKMRVTIVKKHKKTTIGFFASYKKPQCQSVTILSLFRIDKTPVLPTFDADHF
jgi:hypothetical protein